MQRTKTRFTLPLSANTSLTILGRLTKSWLQKLLKRKPPTKSGMKSRLRLLRRKKIHSFFPAKLALHIAAANRKANFRASRLALAAIPARASSGLSVAAGIAAAGAVATIGAAESAAAVVASIAAAVT